MFQKTIKTAFISLILIILIHYLYIFFKTNLTIPKVKDLIYKPTIQYREIYKIINKNTDEQSDMKNELKEYLQSLSNTKTNLPFENLQSGQALNQFQLGGVWTGASYDTQEERLRQIQSSFKRLEVDLKI